MAANANVGVAKAAYFPQLSLTGQFGAASTVKSPASRRDQPPFGRWPPRSPSRSYEGGAITKAPIILAWDQRTEAELTYKQTVQTAFGIRISPTAWSATTSQGSFA